jgi:hypothetical protein
VLPNKWEPLKYYREPIFVRNRSQIEVTKCDSVKCAKIFTLKELSHKLEVG